MFMRSCLLSVLLLAMLLLGTSIAHCASEEGGHLYAVIFGIVADKSDKITSIRVAEVIDPASGSTEPIPVKPAETYITAAENAIRAKGYKARIEDGKPVEFFTYFFYDPAQPDRIDLDPKTKK